MLVHAVSRQALFQIGNGEIGLGRDLCCEMGRGPIDSRHEIGIHDTYGIDSAALGDAISSDAR